MLRRRSTETLFEEIVAARRAPCDEKSARLLPEEVDPAEEDVSGPLEEWPNLCVAEPTAEIQEALEALATLDLQHDLEAMMESGWCSPPVDVVREPKQVIDQGTLMTATAWPVCDPVDIQVVTPQPRTKPMTKPRKKAKQPRKNAGNNQAEIMKTKHLLKKSNKRRTSNPVPTTKRLEIEQKPGRQSTHPPAKPRSKLFGPAPGVRHETFGNPPPNENGHQRLVTHPAGKNVMFNKGVGVDTFVVDGIKKPPGEGVIERLEIAVHKISGAMPKEKAKTEVQPGQRFLAATIRDTPLPIGENADEKPVAGLNWWRVSGNKFQFIYGESSKTAAGKMDKGIIRCASWQLRYSQARVQNGKETEVFAYTVPDTFIIRSACAEIDQRNAEKKRIINVKKGKLIELLKDHGCTERLTLKRPYGQLEDMARDMGLIPVTDDETSKRRRF